MLIGSEIQKFRNVEMLKFINVEVYISKTLGVFLNVLSISQSCTHRARILKIRSLKPWVICWPVSVGSCLKFKSTRTTWCSQNSWPPPRYHPVAAQLLPFQPQSKIQMAQPPQSNGQRWQRWLLDSDLSLENTPLPPFPPCLVFCFTSL